MTELSAAGRARLAAIRDAQSLSALSNVLGVADEHEAYFAAKARWRRLRGRELDPSRPAADAGTDSTESDDAGIDTAESDGAGTDSAGIDTAESDGAGSDGAGTDSGGTGDVPMSGVTVRIGERDVHVHGVTHADTRVEREYLREHVRGFLDTGHTLYCEQGIRGVYFRDFAGACAMDDYRWALRECQRRGIESHVDGDPFASLAEDVGALASQFQEAAFSLVDASGDRFGRRFERALGTVASAFFRSHADRATGADFASFRLREQAAADPSSLWRLQRYYECAFLPQPLEREWLRRHDPELELVTHARNARMADYVVHHADGTTLDRAATSRSGSSNWRRPATNRVTARRRRGTRGPSTSWSVPRISRASATTSNAIGTATARSIRSTSSSTEVAARDRFSCSVGSDRPRVLARVRDRRDERRPGRRRTR